MKPIKYQQLRGWFNWEPIYDEVAEYLQPGDTHVEIGVYEGRSMCYLWEKLGKKPVRLIGIDLFAWHVYVSRPTRGHISRENPDIYTHCCHVMDRAGVLDAMELWQGYSNSFHPLFKKGELASILIDGGHTYYECYQDLKLWWDKIKTGGYVIVHDYLHPYEGLKEVTTAVDDFCNKLKARGEKFTSYVYLGGELDNQNVSTFVIRKGEGFKIQGHG